MSEKLGIMLKASIDISRSVKDMNLQIKELSRQLDPLMLKTNIDTTQLRNMNVQPVRDLSNNLNTVQETALRTTPALNTVARSTESLGATFLSAGKKFAQWLIVGNTIMKIYRNIRDGVQFVNDMNKSLTEIGMVAKMSTAELTKFSQEVNGLAKNMAQSTKDMIDASVLYFRQGKSQAEVLELVKGTTVAASIANMGLTETTEYLTSTLNGMQIPAEKVMDVIDKYAAVGSKAATSFGNFAA